MKSVLVVAMVGGTACGGCGEGGEGAPECSIGETLNPVTGQCVPDRTSPGEDGDAGTEDVFRNPYIDASADIPEEDFCNPNLDSDLDGLTNGCECELGTDPRRADTDRDGLLDGEEDANGNCKYDLGIETNPLVADTDNDGLSDGEEAALGTNPLNPDSDGDGILDGVEVASGCMNPLSTDTDGDGLPDDLEDLNGDGELGTCVNRVYTPECAGEESDPCKVDTDGDGVPDNEDARYLACRPEDTANLVDPQFVESAAGDFKMALDASIATGAVNGLNAFAFNDAPHGYAGFVASLPKPSGATTIDQLNSHMFARVVANFAGAQRATGRRTQTHDGHTTVVSGIVELAAGLRADTVRDTVLSSLAGVGSVSHGTSGTFTATGGGDRMLVVYQVIARPGSNFIVSAAAVPESRYSDNTSETGFRVDDATGGTAIAAAGEGLESECVAYRNDRRAMVDFIWILDGSGSMDDEMRQVRQFAAQFVSILQNSNLDWRIGVVSSGCWEIHLDSNITPDVKALFDPAGAQGPCPGVPPISLPFPITEPPYTNGRLCNNAFTTDAAQFAACVDEVRRSSGLSEPSEHTMSIGAAAIGRALPRSDTNPSKIRQDAAIVLVSVTDEFDQLVQNKMGWSDGFDSGGHDPTTAGNYDQSAVDTVVAPFVNYFLGSEVAATMFGIYWVPGTTCSSAAEAAAGIHTVVGATGGTAGSVCQSDLTSTLQEIATASVGIASGLRLRGTPVAPSIVTTVGQVSSGMIVDWPRSRADGWDYDSTVNRVTFQGATPPQTGDRVVIAYRRWENSVQGCTTNADCPREQKYQCVAGQCL